MYKNILVPVLLDEQQELRATFEVVRSLADESSRFTLLHVNEPLPAYVASQVPSGILERTREQADQQLGRLATELPGAATKTVTGHAGRAIVEFSRDHGIDCIVITSHRPGMEHYFLGSTADRVVRHANCSVHVIRPVSVGS